MKPEAVLTADLDEEELARVDALAKRRGVSREEMLLTLVRAGLQEREGKPAPAPPRRPARPRR